MFMQSAYDPVFKPFIAQHSPVRLARVCKLLQRLRSWVLLSVWNSRCRMLAVFVCWVSYIHRPHGAWLYEHPTLFLLFRMFLCQVYVQQRSSQHSTGTEATVPRKKAPITSQTAPPPPLATCGAGGNRPLSGISLGCS